MDVTHPAPDERPAARLPADRRRWLVPLLVVVLGVVLAVASPMRYGEKNSGRYLIPVLRAMDGELFRDDPVVGALETLHSLFYGTAKASFRLLGTSPDDLEPTWRALYGASRALLPLVLLVLARSIDRSLWLFVFLCAWAAHPKSGYMGGEKLFGDMLRHNEVAIPLGLLALALLLRRKTVAAWCLLGATVLVHPLIGYQLALALLGAAVWHRGIDRRLLAGLAVFGACVLYYLEFMSPPPLTASEAELFWQMKQGSGHFSLEGQILFGWLKTGAVVTLGWLGTRHLAPKEEKPGLVVSAMVCACLAGAGLAAVISVTDNLWLARVQPMRFFVWVTFLAHFLIAFCAARALRRGLAVAPALIAVTAFSIIDSLWFVSFTVLAAGDFAGRELAADRTAALEIFTRRATAAHLALVAGVWALGHRQPFEGFADPANLLPVLALLPLVMIPTMPKWREGALVGLLLAASMAAATWRLFEEAAERRQPAWEEVGRWIRQSTPKDARFVLAPPGPGNFRFLTHRTSVSEPMPTLAWIAPNVHLDAQAIADKAARHRQDDLWDLEALCRMGGELGAGYLVVEGPGRQPWRPLHRSAEIRVFACPNEPQPTLGESRSTSSQL